MIDTVRAEAAGLIEELERRTIDEGFSIRVSSVLDGYIETGWLNLVTQESDDGDTAHPDVILLRFWIDPVGPPGYQLIAEAVHRRVFDPSLDPRQTEVMVPEGHEGEAMLLRILLGMRERFGR